MHEPETMRKAIRGRLSGMAKRINHMLEIGQTAPEDANDSWPSHFMNLEIDDPQWPEDLLSSERCQRRAAIAIREAIHAEEREDWPRHREVLDVLMKQLGDRNISLEIKHHDDWEELLPLETLEGESGHSCQASSDADLALTYVMYACFHRVLLGYRFGTCHQCRRLYLKPLHGADSIYEKKACAQKAYRHRKCKKRAIPAESVEEQAVSEH